MKVFIPSNHASSVNPTKGIYDDYIKWIPNAEIVNNPSKADLFLFAGGADVSPRLYGEKFHKMTQPDESRDVEEIFYFNLARKRGVKMLGICRGAQFLTVMAGGKLFQHVYGHGIKHVCFLSDGSVIDVMSTHHQMMNPYELSRDEHKLVGVAHAQLWTATPDYEKGIFYEDGANQQVILPDDFLEPEIIHYPKIDALAIQGHPERQTSDRDEGDLIAQIEVFEAFINNEMDNYEDYRDIEYKATKKS